MRRHVAHWTRWLQLGVVASIAIAIGWTAVHAVRAKPEGTLYITLGELRSRAAEVHDIARNAAAEHLTGTYIRAQSGQLAPRIATLRDELASLEAAGASSGAQTALPLAARLLALTQALAQHGESITAAATIRDGIAVILNALIPLERGARPA
jgi:hypothetical protein